ncbi:MAG: hypothetical protein ACK4SY_02265 [Pyrobaculum sp.]
MFVAIQWVGVLAMYGLYVASFVIMGSWGRRYLPLGAAAVTLTALDLAAYYLGWGFRLLFLLPLAFSVVFRERAAVGFSTYYLVRGAADIYLGGVGRLVPFFELAWALMPLAGGWRFNKKAAATAAMALLLVLVSPHYMGLVFAFSLGLTQIYLLPLAVFLAMSSRSRYPIFPLLAGPQPQLSVHYLTLAVAAGYIRK